MEPEQIMNVLCSRIHSRGYLARTVSVRHLDELEEEMTLRYAQGSLDEDFYQERLRVFNYEPSTYMGNAESVIVIAVPQPTVILVFRWNGVDKPIVLPPTYDWQMDSVLMNQLEECVRPYGYHVAQASLPLKLLAARSGLARYGRNNLCYIPGKGSLHRLVAFVTDVPCLEDTWRPWQLLDRCLRCVACITACPTGAISERRFMLYAERCVTFHNEHTKDFPNYVDRSLHSCLFGCLACQRVCPENKDAMKWIEERERFSEDETKLIVRCVPAAQIPLLTRRKLERIGLRDDYPLLSRNLALLMDR